MTQAHYIPLPRLTTQIGPMPLSECTSSSFSYISPHLSYLLARSLFLSFLLFFSPSLNFFREKTTANPIHDNKPFAVS